MSPKQLNLLEVDAVVGSVVVIGPLTLSALLYYVYDFKASQSNKQHSLIQELLLYLMACQTSCVI